MTVYISRRRRNELVKKKAANKIGAHQALVLFPIGGISSGPQLGAFPVELNRSSSVGTEGGSRTLCPFWANTAKTNSPTFRNSSWYRHILHESNRDAAKIPPNSVRLSPDDRAPDDAALGGTDWRFCGQRLELYLGRIPGTQIAPNTSRLQEPCRAPRAACQKRYPAAR